MGVESVKIALERASLVAEDIGMVIGDTATPIETIPAFASLVAEKLGIKVPAYDITGLSASLPLQIQTLNSWKSEVVPRYSVLVSSNTPTPYLSFSENDDCSWVFSDGAGAVILENTTERVGLVVEDACYSRVPETVGALEEIYGLFRGEAEPLGPSLDIVQDLSDRFDLEDVGSWVVATPTLRSGRVVGEMLGANQENLFWCADEGFSLGSTLYRGLDILLKEGQLQSNNVTVSFREKGVFERKGALLCAVGPDGGVGIVKIHLNN
jgi:hypothetical protein